jgi:septin 7
MTDSYPSTRNGDFSPSTNGVANGAAHNASMSSVIRKKLMGYVGFANLPNQVHRKSVRKGFQFTAMVVGA